MTAHEHHAPASTPGRILVAMSGGVDSSVAAALLHEQGHDLVGVTMHLWDAEPGQQVGKCCAPEDRDDARRTCEHLGIPHYVMDEREAFRDHVVDPFVDGNRAGVTPIPCVSCNQHVKLTRLMELADMFGATHVATGHYARLQPDADGGVQLLRGLDRGKDQSYFLYGVPQAVLSRMIFPLGSLVKNDAREEARRLGLPNWNKPDSQQLCFVPDGDVGGFVQRQGGAEAPGEIVDDTGEVLGKHSGVSRFTIGQRRGLGVAAGKPRYVLRVVPDEQRVVVGDEQALYGNRLEARSVQWTHRPRHEPFHAHVRIRYRHDPAPAVVTPTAEGFEARFEDAQRAVAPGQAAVVYEGDTVVAGGTIV